MSRTVLLPAVAVLVACALWMLSPPAEEKVIAVDSSGETEAASPALAASPSALAEDARAEVQSSAPAPTELDEPARVVETTLAAAPLPDTTTVAITGTLVDQDWAPVPDYDVWLAAADDLEVRALSFASEATETERTDGAGRFAFEHVTPGIWWIAPARDDAKRPDELAAVPVAVEVTEGSSDFDVLVRAHRGLSVAGRVLDPHDRPVKGVVILAHGAGGAVMTETDADGTFESSPLLPGTCRLVVYAPFSGFASPEAVMVEAGDRDVAIRLLVPGSLRGRVASADGELPSGTLLVSHANGNILRASFADGQFALEALAPGRYSLAATTDDGAAIAKEVLVQPGEVQDAVVLELGPVAWVTVRLAGAKTVRSLHALHDGVAVFADGIEPGNELAFVVPLGRITVRLTATGKPSQEREIDVVAAEEVELVFE